MNKILSPVACCVVALLLGGCINISSRITRENQAVKPMTEGSDCSYAIMNFGYGTNTVEQAMANAIPPVQKVRSVSTDLFFFIFFSSHCVTVVGEPAPGVTKPLPYDPTEQRP
jgi:hypothetical protein